MNQLEYNGLTYNRANRGLLSASANVETSLTMESISADTLTAEVRDTRLQTRLLAADGQFVVAQGPGSIGIARTLLVAQGDRYGLNRYNYGQVVR